MKKQLLFISILFAVTFGWSQQSSIQNPGAIVAGSTGNVQFNCAGILCAVNALFWDNTNSRLGINQSAPSVPFDLKTTGSGGYPQGLVENSATGGGTAYFGLTDSGNGAGGNKFEIGATTGSTSATITLDLANTRLGVSQSSPATTLDVNGVATAKRISCDNATTLVTGDFTLGAGWGSTASTAITLSTSKDCASVTTITTAGSGIAANPTYQITFHDGTWTNTPVCIAIQTGGNDIIGDLTVNSRSATAYIFKWNATPTTAKTYEITITCTGT